MPGRLPVRQDRRHSTVRRGRIPGTLAQAEQGKSVKTANDYLAAVKGFTRWLWRDKRSVLDPLAGLSKLANGETDIRHARRDFSPG